MGAFSIWHWLIVLVVVVVIFGTKNLRNIGSDLGGAVRSFRDAIKDDQSPKKVDDASNGGDHDTRQQ